MGIGRPQSAAFQDEERLQELFERLDVNKDGKICSSDLMHALERYHGKNRDEHSSGIAKGFLNRCGVGTTGELSFQDFVNYVLQHDDRLVIAFDQLDRNGDGCVTSVNIQQAFKQFGITIDINEADQLLRRVDQSGKLNMNYGEWREFLLFHPAENVSNIFEYWFHETLIDASGDAAVGIPEDFTFLQQPSGRQLLQITAGAIAGAVSRTCTAPIDRLKLMRQVYGYKHKGSRFVQAYGYMLREGGVLSLWRGNGINVLKIAPETALKYGTYEHYKRLLTSFANGGWLGDAVKDRPLLTHFLAGSMAGSTAQTIIYPLEVLKTRMCLRKTGQFNSIWHCASTIYHQHGLSAFYRGYFVNLIGIIPYAGIELALYEVCRTAYINRFMPPVDTNEQPHLPTAVVPLLASVSSTCGIVVTYPATLVRAKLQATYWSQSQQKKVTALSLIRTIWRADSIFGLYRGMLTNLVKVLPAVSINLATYEALRHQFNLGPLGSG